MCSPRELVAFVVDDRKCALDLAAVERVEPMVAISPLPGAPVGVLGVVDVRGAVVPVLDLRGRLGLPPVPADPDGALLLARTSRRLVALPVDQALGVQLVDPDSLLYIQDLEGFLSPEAERRLEPALTATSK